VPAISNLERLAEIAEDQWGLITRRQAQDARVSPRTLGRLAAEGSVLRRVAHGVYLLAGAPEPDHVALRAAWLQLAPDMFAWDREAADGVVSHRSAADMYGVGHLPADRHDFTVANRRQSRRPDVRIHSRELDDGEWVTFGGLPVTLPARIASDLLFDDEDPGAVAQIVVDSIRKVYDYPGSFSDSLAPHAARFGFRRGDGIAALKWLLDLVGDPETGVWMREARAHHGRTQHEERAPTPKPASQPAP
jgi:hypothetical protein